VCVDNYNRSRRAATALIVDEQKITFEWILQGLLDAADADQVQLKMCGKTRNSTTQINFERNWERLLNSYPEAQSYLRLQLYPNRDAWVLAFTHRFFNLAYNPLKGESQFVRLNEVNRELPRIMLTSYRDQYFITIDDVCAKFLTPAMQKLQRYQMDQCSHYRAYRASLESELQQDRARDLEARDDIIMRTASSNFSSVSINISNIEGQTSIIQEQVHEHGNKQDIQESDQ
ncbi:29349_t:CDS:2, partial [Gigaspora margarita]